MRGVALSVSEKDSLHYLCLMRAIQDPKKRKLVKKKPVVTSQDPDFPESLLSAAIVDGGDNKPLRDSIAMYDNYLDQMRWLGSQGFTQSQPTVYGGFMNRLGSGQGADPSWENQEDKKFVVDRTGRSSFYSNYSDKPVGDERVYDLDNPEDAAYVSSLRDGDSFYEYDDEGFGRYVQDDMDRYFDPGSNSFISRERPPDVLFRDDMQHAGTAVFKSPLGETYTLGVYAKPDGYDEYKRRQRTMGGIKPVGPRAIKTEYKQPEIVETPPTPMLTGRQAIQIGKVAQDRENARYGQVLDKEYYWDDDLKRWQMRPVDEERLGKPFPKDDRKYRLIKASF